MHPPSLRNGLVAWFLLLTTCSSSQLPPLHGVQQVIDLQRFMGPWYVVAAIPIHIPLLPMFSEKGAHNGIETYGLLPDGRIETTYVFRRDSFTGPERRFTPTARVANAPLNSEWKMKFAWYLPAGDYLILYVDADYQRALIGVPDRKYAWIMSRTPVIPPDEYAALRGRLQADGYDLSQLEAVPQQWPAAP